MKLSAVSDLAAWAAGFIAGVLAATAEATALSADDDADAVVACFSPQADSATAITSKQENLVTLDVLKENITFNP
ncbi:hypothetical protein ACO0LF_00840 [Undibacterium sp. Di27W]|uniref:hypothetical protein n=1 Tax=Undibacterium sp. Di27W TaxID=3413036 RepID=UPI003BEFA27B